MRDFSHPVILMFISLNALTLGLSSCRDAQNSQSAIQASPAPSVTPSGDASPVAAVATPAALSELLQQSWDAYRRQFIQSDGRVIDLEQTADNRTVSEGQAYAMLRAVMIGDRATFDLTLNWAENNLQRKDANGKQIDNLWSWKWGRTPQGGWGIIDANFASDADVDAVTALIFAYRRWQDPAYLALARTKLKDLWNYSTLVGKNAAGKQVRYFLPGPTIAFQEGNLVTLNPSYLAPYAFRLFAQIDSEHDWLSLVDSSYEFLDAATEISNVRLPGDWVAIDRETGILTPLLSPPPGTSEYGFDAYRVWWRVGLDWDWFKEPRAKKFLEQRMTHLKQVWKTQKKLPARIDLQGNPIVDFESTAQYGMVYFAMKIIDPAIAREIEQQKIAPTYRNGYWDSNSAYYTHNLIWLGLVPSANLTALIRP